MNEALKEIANKHEVSVERIPEILTGMKVKNPEKPTKRQLEGFEKVCTLIKEGKPIEESLEIVVMEAKNGTKESPSESQLEDDQLDKFITEQANRAAEATLTSLPQVAVEEYQRVREKFVQAYQKRIAELLNDPQYKQQFVAAIEGQEMGKLNLLSSTLSNIALPSSSSSSS